MKTVFVCDSLNLRVEGLDNRPYSVNERITLKHQGRWLPMIVEEVRERGDIRQIVLRVNHAPDSVFLQRKSTTKASQPALPIDRSWLEGFFKQIEGSSGTVVW